MTSSCYFDDLGERYARFNARRDRLLPATGRWLRKHLPGGGRAADLGCGEGRRTTLLADRYERVLAVDVSERMLALARVGRSRSNVQYQQRGVLDVTPERDGRFDAVLSVNVLHHVGAPEAVLPHVRRLVAPGGHVVLVDLVNPGRWGDRDWHITQSFDTAKDFYHQSGGDPQAAVDVLRLALHPRWLDMMAADLPPSREEFCDQVRSVFPGATFADGLPPVMCGMAWHAPR